MTGDNIIATVFKTLVDHLRNRNVEEAKRLVTDRPELLDYVDDCGRLALHWACSCGTLPFVQMIFAGENAENIDQLINRVDDMGWTLLMIASSAGHLSVVNYLLSFVNCDVNAKNKNGQTALHYACSKDHAAIARVLIDHDADVNAADRYGATPLHHAAAQLMLDSLMEELFLFNNASASDAALFKHRYNILLKLFALEPTQAERCISAIFDASMTDNAQLVLALQLLCNSSVFRAEFFVNTLISRLIQRDDAFIELLRARINRICARKLCERFSEIVAKLENDASPASAAFAERVLVLMALLSAQTPLRPTPEECRQWAHYLTHPPHNAPASIHKMTLAVLIACPNLMPNNQAFRDELLEGYLIDYFRRLRELATGVSPDPPDPFKPAASASAGNSSLSRMMLLVAIHMQTDDGVELANLVSSILGFKVPNTLSKLPTVSALFGRHAVTERDIVAEAARLGVTRSLNSHSAGYLPVHCINHLLASRSFSKHQIPIQEWIKRQMLECTAPVHPIMTNLLRNFSASCVPSAEHDTFNAAIDEEFFWEIFSADIFDRRRTSTVVQLLALFYLIAYTFKLETTSPALFNATRSAAADGIRLRPYSTRLWARIPIRYLLLVLDARHEDYAAFRPVLLRFVAAWMPHMLPDIHSTLRGIDFQMANYNDFNFSIVERSCVSTRALAETLREFAAELTTKNNNGLAQAASFMSALSRIDVAPIHEQYRHWQTIVDAMQVTLAPATPRYVIDKVVRIWQRLENLIPRRLYEATLQKWLSGERAAISGQSGKCAEIRVDNEMLVAETPLILFRVDERIFRSGPHLRCLMQMLSFYLKANKNANNVRLLKASTVAHSKGEMEEKAQLFKSLIGAQYLTVVQLLLELCDEPVPNADDDDANGRAPSSRALAEVREICCAQIHQMFIADSLLPNLVHFNTYSRRLIPIMVRGVPSAHVLIDFLGELLASPNLEQRIFAICLMAELIEKYKIPTAFAGVGLISDVLDTLLGHSIDEEHVVLFTHITPAIVRLVKVSAFHAAALTATLERMRDVTHARLALYSSVVAARRSPEERLASQLDAALAKCRATFHGVASGECTRVATPTQQQQQQQQQQHKTNLPRRNLAPKRHAPAEPLRNSEVG